jgi:hypothetical protein
MSVRDPCSPFAGLRVLHLPRVLAGPFAGRLMSDLGADVVKVEPPEGDITRMWGKSIGGVPGYSGPAWAKAQPVRPFFAKRGLRQDHRRNSGAHSGGRAAR